LPALQMQHHLPQHVCNGLASSADAASSAAACV